MKTFCMCTGYARLVDTCDVVVQFFLYGEDFNTPYCPVIFR